MGDGLSRRGLIAATAAVAASPAWAASAKVAITPDDMVMGSAAAPLTLVEYASASCPHCAHFHTEVFPALREKYIRTGKVRFVFREILTPPAQIAAAGFVLARCAGKARYFDVLGAFFAGQAKAYETKTFAPLIAASAKAGGLSQAQAEACIRDEKALAAVDARVQRNAAIDNIDSTPTFVLNGRKLSTTGATFAELDAEIAPLLRPARR